MKTDTPTHEQRMYYVDKRMKAIRKVRVRKVLEVGREGEPDLISGSLLLGMLLRESGGRNVLGDYDKKYEDWAHARGAFQVHDTFHMEFLSSVVGCRALPYIPNEPMSFRDKIATRAAWIPIRGTKASHRGLCPTIEDGARYAVKILSGHISHAKTRGVKNPKDQLCIAIAAYNCGFTGALSGWRKGDIDMNTTGGDYSRDVLNRRSEINEWLNDHPNWKA